MKLRLTAERLIGLLVGLFAALFVAVRTNRTAAFDLAVTLKLQERRTPAVDELMRVVSWPGFPPQSRIIAPAIIGAWWLAGQRRAAAFQLLAWGAAALSTGIKAAIRRPRPMPPQVQVVVAPLGGTSFPSGHVLTYVGFYGFLGFLLADRLADGATRGASVAATTAVIALIGPSRIEQGHHWATDVVASYLLGFAYLLLLVQLYHGSTQPGASETWLARTAAR
jgi:membrane-associated phospholipid phosphatase